MKFAFGFFTLFTASAMAAMQLVGAVPAAPGQLTKRSSVGVKSLKCDGDSYKCIAELKYGDGNWAADWSTSVLHGRSFGRPFAQELITMSPSRVKALYCDGDTYLCTATLEFGDGKWVAQWPVAVMQQTLFSGETEDEVRIQGAVKVTELTCDGDTYRCTGKLDFGNGNWIAQWSASVHHHKKVTDESFFL